MGEIDMQGKVILEEHFAIEATLSDSRAFAPEVWDRLGPQLADIEKLRLPEMDANGIEWMILSLNAPAVQAIWDVKQAVAVAREANDHLAAEAGEENTALYYDLPQYRPFWKAVEELDVPFYLHPRNPLPSWSPIYQGHNWMLAASWAFAAETAVHALRLIGSGLFDVHPRLKIIIGHLGEGIPANLWRIDHRNEWMKKRHAYAAKKGVADYMRKNFWITTSGNFATAALTMCMAELGVDRVMFSTDYPFEDIAQSVEWFDNVGISEADRLKIGRTNALTLFRMG
jgi:predicted TIM-barrel fold metal-dependent hydrolase